jgi:hypothetical protein
VAVQQGQQVCRKPLGVRPAGQANVASNDPAVAGEREAAGA